jgi:hypothetical protein
MSKLFPAITAAKSFGVEMPLAQAHDRVLAALQAGGFHKVDDLSDEIKAEHGNTALFVYGTVSGDITIALTASPSADYPVSLDVQFHEIEGGTQVVANASYMRPITYMGAPRFGPQARKWHEACDSAIAVVVASCEVSA